MEFDRASLTEPTDLETRIADGPKLIADKGGFAVIGIGDYYVQLAALDEDLMVFEAMSDRHLQWHRRINRDQRRALEDLGLRIAAHRAGNYSCTVDRRATEQFPGVARRATDILCRVYRCRPEAQVDLQVHPD